MTSKKWIEVASTPDPTEAQVIKSYLEANSIEVILSQESFVNSFGIVNQQLPKIFLLVSPDNKQSAISLMNEYSLESGE